MSWYLSLSIYICLDISLYNNLVPSRLGIVYSKLGSSLTWASFNIRFLENFLLIYSSVSESNAHCMLSKEVSIKNNEAPKVLENSYMFTVLHIP